MPFHCLVAAQCDTGSRTRQRRRLAIILFTLSLLALPLAALAQSQPDSTDRAAGFTSPIVPSATAVDLPSPTVTEAATATLALTPTPELLAAVLQVSPLGLVPDDRPMEAAGAMPWLIVAALIVVAGAAALVVVQHRK